MGVANAVVLFLFVAIWCASVYICMAFKALETS
jgi:hypothetical protein